MKYARTYRVTLPSGIVATVRRSVIGSEALLAVLSARLAVAIENASRRCLPRPPERSMAKRFALVAEESVTVGITADYLYLLDRLGRAWSLSHRQVVAAVLRAELVPRSGQAAA